jgi:hypothetical protein
LWGIFLVSATDSRTNPSPCQLDRWTSWKVQYSSAQEINRGSQTESITGRSVPTSQGAENPHPQVRGSDGLAASANLGKLDDAIRKLGDKMGLIVFLVI